MNQIENQKEKQKQIIMNRISKVISNAKKIIIKPKRPLELKFKIKSIKANNINIKEESITDYDF